MKTRLTKHQKEVLAKLQAGTHKIVYDKVWCTWELKVKSTCFGYDSFLLASTVHRLQDAGLIRYEFATYKLMFYVAGPDN